MVPQRQSSVCLEHVTVMVVSSLHLQSLYCQPVLVGQMSWCAARLLAGQEEEQELAIFALVTLTLLAITQ